MLLISYFPRTALIGDQWNFARGSLMRISIGLLMLINLFSCTTSHTSQNADQRPNILLLVADDLGYADLGCYGGDIETPNIDQLAIDGIRCSRFYTSPLCAPTRAMLLSGNDNHIAGMGRQGPQTSVFGYEGNLSDRVATVPQLLRQSGYHTYIAGKWHLGISKNANPVNKGFERSFVNVISSGNHYNDQGIFEFFPRTPYTEDGKQTAWKKGKYSTDFYTDKLIEYIDSNIEDNQPFFAFAAYTSPHWPLQVDEKYWRKYEGRYDSGYEDLKVKRLESLKDSGMIPGNTTLPLPHELVIPWNSLSVEEKKKESRKMELYAGMVDNLDENIGRLTRYLKEVGEFENTIIVFMSDNGAAAEDFFYNDYYRSFLEKHFNDDYENMGKADSYISYGPQWAEAGTSPFKYFKGYTTEGGMIAPMILTGPGINRRTEIFQGFVTVMDLAPTFYEAAHITYPKSFNGHKLYPLKGKSIFAMASGETDIIHNSDYVFGLELTNYAMIRKGDWKITNIERPFQADNFGLFHVSEDLGELHDLKNKHPEKFSELLAEWEKFSNDIGVYIPDR